MNARPIWLGQRERGSRRLMSAITTIALRIGRPVGRMLLYPICAYFLTFSRSARPASRAYLQRVLGRRPRWIDVFRHYHCFAAVILDRVFLLAGRVGHFEYEIEGLDDLLAAIAGGRGCLLFGAHFGSFEVLRVMAMAHAPVPVRVFVSYAHDDERQLKRLDAILDVLEQQHGLSAWRDQRLITGDQWDEEIRRRLLPSKLAM